MKAQKRGFTLVELLVVISIIALLMSILMPALNEARTAAYMLKGKANQRQAYLGFYQYTASNDSKSLISYGGASFWMIQIAPFLGDKPLGMTMSYDSRGFPIGGTIKSDVDAEQKLQNVEKILQCPLAKYPTNSRSYTGSSGNGEVGAAKKRYRYHATNIVGSFGCNSWALGWTGGSNGNFNPTNPSSTARKYLAASYRYTGPTSEEVPVFTDCIWVGGQVNINNTDGLPSTWTNFTWDGGDQSRGMGRFVTNRHGDKTNVAFWNGSVRTIQLKELWDLKWHKKSKAQNYKNIFF